MASDDIARLAELLREFKGASRTATVLTGAGVSTESGIPDFRSPGTGLYCFIDPMEYLSVRALERTPEKLWKFFADSYAAAADYQPNAGHAAIAKLEEAGYVGAVVTQNIDNLHQRAGSRNVLEVHGHLRTAHCTACGVTVPFTSATDQVLGGAPVPTCAECGSLIRPDVVLFGDDMPADFLRASEAVRSGSLLLVVGSSLEVSPVNYFAFEAERLAIINRSPTPADRRADVVIHGSAGDALSSLAAELGVA